MSLVKRFMREEEGATMVEYGIMVALIAAVCIVAVGLLGDSLSSIFGTVEGAVADADATATAANP